MDFMILIAYGICHIAMILYYLLSGKNRYFEFPFWFGAIGLGWFYPLAIGAYHRMDLLPDGYFQKGILFATLCSVALWCGYAQASRRGETQGESHWLMQRYDPTRLYYVCLCLCLMGFFFYYKLETLPDALKATSMWTGVPVMYLFLAGMFKIGFIGLFIMYLQEKKFFSIRFVILIPCFALLLIPVVLGGRRAEMMRFIGFTLFPLWFVRRFFIPRIWIVFALVLGIILINAIGLYRSAMKGSEDLSFSERIKLATQQDYLEENEDLLKTPGGEIINYMYGMASIEKLGTYDFGFAHWNQLVFNYVPAQWVGRSFKDSLYCDWVVHPIDASKQAFGYRGAAGATWTGYGDAFTSFSYFGAVKFWIIGLMMGTLYKKAMQGFFLPQLLFAFALSDAMHSISHTTNEILIRIWIYFFIFGYFPFKYAIAQDNPYSVAPVEN